MAFGSKEPVAAGPLLALRVGMPATALHERLFKIDTHCDTPTARLRQAGWDLAERHAFAADHSQCDLPRMAGNVDAMVFAIYTA